MAKKEIHNAVVSRNLDDDLGLTLRGAVFFEAPTLFQGEYPLPAYPCFNWASDKGAGFFVVPKVNDEIEIEIEVDDGSFDTTDVELPEPRWRCMLYSDVSDIDDIFKVNYPYRMGFKSNSGHYWLMDDNSDTELFKLMTGKGHQILLDDTKDNNKILIQSIKGHKLLFDDQNDLITFTHQNGTKYDINTDGDWLENIVRDKVIDVLNDYGINVTNNYTETIGGKKTINVTGDCELTCANAKVTASSKVEVTGATIELNGNSGRVVTDQTSPFIDLITGANQLGIPTVLGG